ncbi:methyltransferase domain-containing protein [Ignavibacterium sp.]|uniref:methyltransferase domain-containing protein n=1 Tax=Ignavibacterium sp. TaxID=2651167 RepID=UPI00307E5920
MTKSNKQTCIICTFLPLIDEYKNLWNRISDLLSQKNFELVLLTSSENFDGVNFPVIHVPFSLKGFYEQFGLTDFNDQNLTENDFHLIEKDIFWNKDLSTNFEKYFYGFKGCKQFYTNLIKELKPSIVFVWGNLLPQSLIFKELLENHNIPSFYLERGYFPGTLMIEDVLNKEMNSISTQLNYESDKQIPYDYFRLKNFYDNNLKSKYPENHDFELEKFILDKKENGFNVVCFYGTHDTAYFPSEQSYSKEVSLIFKYTTEGANFLSQNIDQLPKTILIFKPHPKDENDYSNLQNHNFIVTKNFFNRRLFDLTDAIIIGNSTIQYEALLSENPVILIAKSAAHKLNATYNPNSKENLLEMISSAVQKVDFDEKFINSKLFFNHLIKSHIYFYSDDSVGKSLIDFVEFISNCSINIPNDINLSEKLTAFETKVFLQKQISNQKENNNFRFLITEHLKSKFYGLIQTHSHEFDKKISEYSSYLISGNKNNLILQAEALIEKNSFDDARALLNDALTNPKLKLEAHNDLAYIEIVQENYSEALNNILTVLQINPNDEIAINNLNYLIENNFLDTSFVNAQLKKILRPDLKLNKVRSFDEFVRYEQTMRGEYKTRSEFENNLLPDNSDNFTYNGYCIVCESIVPFHVDFWNAYNINGKKIPNWRERLVCPGCGLNNRMRLTYHLITELFSDFPSSSTYITEQTTNLFRLLKQINQNLIGSEYLGNEVPNGEVNNSGIRNEDFTNLSFADEQFGYIISLEVLEHIPDYRKALEESFRTLKQNGKFLFTVPFNRNSKENLVRARLNYDGTITHLQPPEYHGDPLNRIQGCLCYYHFGWELLDDLKTAGFSDAYAIFTYSKEFGYLGGEQIFFIATKE